MKKIKIDYHIHSQFSADSKAQMDTIIEKAIRKGYREIAFSDHFDLLPAEIAIYGVPSYHQYSQAIEKMRKKYPEITIRKSIELGEYHRCYQTVDAILEDYSPDIKMGAIHVLPTEDTGNGSRKGNMNISLPFRENVNQDLIKLYYTENLRLVQHGNFDILAHLGVYKRYLNEPVDERCAYDIIREIFKNIIEKNIALEINLSGLRKPLKRTVPDSEILNMYTEMGGDLLIIGSDTHHLDEFDLYYEQTLEQLQKSGLPVDFYNLSEKVDRRRSS